MKRFQWKWIFTGSKTCCTIWQPFWLAMAAILNPKWPPKYKNPPIWAKFGFQVDLALANWYSSSFLELGAIGWGDVRYCFAMAILVIITSPRLLSGDVLLFYVSFSLLLLLFLFKQILDSYHQTSWNFVGISTVVCGSS